MLERRKQAFEEWFSNYGVLTSQSKYTLALSETRDKLAYYANNPIGGGTQNINIRVYPEHSVYEFDDPIRLRNLFDDCTKQNVRDDGAMHTAVGWYAMWLRLKAPDQWKDVEEWPNDNERKKTMKNRGYDYDAVLGQRLSLNGHSANTHIDSAYLAAIRTKPIILLAGISGTGKSRMVRQLARGCCPSGHELGKDKAGNADKAKMPGNFEMIPVRPNWHDSTELIGYVTRLTDGNKPKYVIKPFVKFLVKAAIYKDVPFFLCLDEMNLAPVEQYFAEYLSIVETRKKENGAIRSDVLVNFDLPEIDVVETVKELMKDWWSLDADNNLQWATADAKAVYDNIVADKGIRIPENFIVMGTVNMDETTCSFSRKVLDRAMTFELNEVDMDEGLAEDNSIRYGSIPASSAFATDVEGCDFYAANKDTCEKIKTYLIAVNKVLDGTPFKFAYRSRNEIMLYCIERTKGGIVELPQALDEATSMKILSRIEGDEQKLQVPKKDNNGKIVKGADGRAEMVCLLDKDVLPKVVADALKKANGGNDPNPPCTVCSEKLAFMAGRLESGFTNFFV